MYTKTSVQGFSLKHCLQWQEPGNNLNTPTKDKLKELWHIKRAEYCTTAKKNEVELYVFTQQIPNCIKEGKYVKNSVHNGLPGV